VVWYDPSFEDGHRSGADPGGLLVSHRVGHGSLRFTTIALEPAASPPRTPDSREPAWSVPRLREGPIAPSPSKPTPIGLEQFPKPVVGGNSAHPAGMKRVRFSPTLTLHFPLARLLSGSRVSDSADPLLEPGRAGTSQPFRLIRGTAAGARPMRQTFGVSPGGARNRRR
jgi:hypothetical protein